MNRDYLGYVFALISIVISVFFSWYFYNKSLQFREPHYMTDVFPQSVFDAQKDPSTPFKVMKNDGSPLTSSVYIANHKLWNNGTQPILASDILKPITVSFVNNGKDKDTNILAVSVAKSSREVADCNVILDAKNRNSFIITFRLLEQNDGCLIKIFYSGNQYPDLNVSGEIIGVNSISLHNKSIDEYFKGSNLFRYLSRIPEFILFFALSVFVFMYMNTRSLPRKSIWLRSIVYSFIVLEIAMTAGLVVHRQNAIYSGISSPSTEKWISTAIQ